MVVRIRSFPIARASAWIMYALLATAAAFSAGQTPAASDAARKAEPDLADPMPAERPDVAIALVLPLDSETYARAAGAVRAGFLAAADAAGERASCLVIGHGDNGVVDAFEAARAAGARVVVGPLVRDDLKAIDQSTLDLPYTLALNQLDEGTPASPRIYTLALGVESDARTIARRMRDTAAQNVIIIGGDTPLMKRFAGAFATSWLLDGGGAPNALPFDASPEALTALKRSVGRANADVALLALDGANAARGKPYLGPVASYASGLVFERQTPAMLRDLDGLTIVEIPWLATPDAPELAGLPRRDFGSAALERLYALGLDAFRVARAFRNGPPERFSLDGATGRLTLAEGRQFSREGRLAVYRAGLLVPLGGGR
jgi:outer membrane PBP1 activator LpoA protein